MVQNNRGIGGKTPCRTLPGDALGDVDQRYGREGAPFLHHRLLDSREPLCTSLQRKTQQSNEFTSTSRVQHGTLLAYCYALTQNV